MLDTNEIMLLRGIAENYDDDMPRLVYADWLEEHGEEARSEFIRVQCELASKKLADDQREPLRRRERELLESHRHEWLQTLGVPVEDVSFQRGMFTGLRLSTWEGGNLLDAKYASRLATLTELDLSEIGLDDDGLCALAKSEHFPALAKLNLGHNKITATGVKALAEANSLRRLKTVYLFDNPIGEDGGGILRDAVHLRLKNLDLGELDDGYCMSAGQAETARRKFLREHLLPFVSKQFKKHTTLQSAMLCVGQYWCDEAIDAVHGIVVVSELMEPTLAGVGWESKSDINIPNTPIKQKYGGRSSALTLWDTPWDDNSGAIPLWAAFAPEGGHQEYGNYEEVYAPAVMFYRHGGYDFLPMQRPFLDGIRPEWDGEDD